MCRNILWLRVLLNQLCYVQHIVLSICLNVTGSSFQTLGAATEKSRLPKLSLVLGTISCCEMDDLSCRGVFERWRRLAKLLRRGSAICKSGQFYFDSISSSSDEENRGGMRTTRARQFLLVGVHLSLFLQSCLVVSELQQSLLLLISVVDIVLAVDKDARR